MSRLPTGPDLTPTSLFNPTKEDFICTYANDQNIPQEYILPSRQIQTFEKYIADHIAKHLAQKIAFEVGGGLAYELRFNHALEQIYVIL